MTTKVLNLYAGIGGNRKLWDDVDVTAVEWDEDKAEVYRDHFPKDTVVVTDAHDFLKETIFNDWDFIWSSPPCPTHSRINHFNQTQHQNAKYPDMGLYQEIILLQHHSEREDYDFVVENVKSYYDPLIEPYESGGHYFWSNYEIEDFETPSRSVLSDAGGRDLDEQQDRLGYDLSDYNLSKSKKGKMLRNCVNPELGKRVLEARETPDQATLSDV